MQKFHHKNHYAFNFSYTFSTILLFRLPSKLYFNILWSITSSCYDVFTIYFTIRLQLTIPFNVLCAPTLLASCARSPPAHNIRTIPPIYTHSARIPRLLILLLLLLLLLHSHKFCHLQVQIITCNQIDRVVFVQYIEWML